MCLKFQTVINVLLVEINSEIFKRLYINSLCYQVEQPVDPSNIFLLITS